MKANNTFTAPKKEKQAFSLAVTSSTMQNLMTRALGDSKAVARLTSTLLSAVSASEQLKACEAATIVASALRGEGMGLIYGHGYYLVPYGQVCTFSLSYKGLIQLAIATGQYADLDCVDVRQGEQAGRDRRTGKPVIDLSVYETDEEREAQPIIGYYAYFELKDGTFRYEYWSMDRLLKHADRYSSAFSLEKYNALLRGELSDSEMKKCLNGTPWYDAGGGQDRMCRKTVLRQLLNSGYAPLSAEVRSLLRAEEEGGDLGIIPDIAGEGATIVIDPDTGEVQDAPQEPEKRPESGAGKPDEHTPAGNPGTTQDEKFSPQTEDEEVFAGFFGDGET